MKKVFATGVIALTLVGFIGCSSDSPTSAAPQADVNQGTLTEHANLPNATLTSGDMNEFFESITGNLTDLTDITSLEKKRLAKKTSRATFDTTINLDTTLNGLSGSASYKATIKCTYTMNSSQVLTNENVSIQNASIVFNNFSMNDSTFLAGQIVGSANLSMTQTTFNCSISANAGIRFNGIYKGQLTMNLSAGLTGDPSDEESVPKITGTASMDVTSNGSSFTYTQDLSKIQGLSKKKF